MFIFTQEDDDLEWPVVKPDIYAAIMDFFTTGQPVVSEVIQAESGEEPLSDS